MARQIFSEVDNSLSVAQAPGIVTGIVLVADRGRVDEAVSIETVDDLVRLYGKPDSKKSVTMYSAISYLQKASNLQVSRAIHTAADGTLETDSNRTARYSAALLRGKVAPIPDSTPDGSWVPDRVVEPLQTADGFGLTQKQINQYTFPVYAREREYKELKNKIAVATTDSNIAVVNTFDNIKEGSKLSFGTNPDDDSPVFEVLALKEETVKQPKITASKPVTVDAGAKLRRVVIKEEELSGVTLNGQLTAGTNKVATLSDVSKLQSGMTIYFAQDTKKVRYVIQSINTNNKQVTFRTAISNNVNNNSGVFIEKREYIEYGDDYVAQRAVSGSDEIIMKTIDLVANNDVVTFMTGLTNAETEFTVKDKGIYNEAQKQLVMDKETTLTTDTKIQLMTASEFENRDVLLIYSDNQGSWGNKITVEVLSSVDYPDKCRVIKVYEDGVDTGEKFEVSFDEFVDGLGKQLYVEDVINGKSNFIRVKHNKDMVDDNGKAILPILNDYSVWRENPDDIFEDSGYTIKETTTYGETDIKVSDFTKLELGTRIKFGDFDDEYKVTGKSSKEVGDQTEYHITIDRGIQVDKIPLDTPVKIFKEQKFKKPQKIDGTIYTQYKLNYVLVISGKIGKLVDCGGNLFVGGHDGSIPDVGDLSLTLDKVFGSKEVINVNMLLSGGIFNPVYARALTTLCENRGDCFAFLSNDPSTMDNTDPVKAVEQFRSDLNINSNRAGLFADWVEVYDNYNKKNVYASVDGVAAALQSVSSDGGQWGYPVAGWLKGVLFNVNGLYYTWSENQREKLLNSQINPCKKMKTRGISIWGNKTLYAQRSYMQNRNVIFLLMQMRIEVADYMESKHWSLNDAGERALMIQVLLDSFQKYNTVTNKIEMFDKTTPADEDAGILNIYVGVVPKGTIENISVTFGIFSNSQGITVS